MPKYIVTVDVITVHVVPVLANSPEAAEAEAGRIVAGDWETWFDHAEPVVVGDAQTETEYDSAAEVALRARMAANSPHTPVPARRPKPSTPTAKHRTTRTDHHADGSECPPAHKHPSSGKPRTEGCPGRAYSTAKCTCGWTTRSTVKTYVDETRKRHTSTEHG
ncbi:hypothetical protein ACFC6L_19325 [Kitasatospora phosalacinea]|uniref:hypothetical protein n=1 Tax=Kitasatospora phosalacinea TaxID=2065 RepID=UPI0035DA2F5A